MDMRTDPLQREPREPTIGELIRSLLMDVGQLVRTEIKLAYTEVGRNVARAGKPLAFMAIGGVLIFGAFLTLLAAVIALLAPIVGIAAAALIVALAVGGIGAALLLAARKRLAGLTLLPTRSLMPPRPPASPFKGTNHDPR